MKIDKLKQSYKNQLLKAGIALPKAEEAVRNITLEELQLILEIWSEWALYLERNEL